VVGAYFVGVVLDFVIAMMESAISFLDAKAVTAK